MCSERLKVLHQMNVDVRLFILLKPPGMSEREAVDGVLASFDAARSWVLCSARKCHTGSGGNGAMEHYQAAVYLNRHTQTHWSSC